MTSLVRTVVAQAERARAYEGHTMRGWYVFGCDLLKVEVRELDGSEDWPAGELFEGVAGVHISAYADDTTGAFVKAWGPDRAAVEVAYRRAIEAFPSFAAAIWIDMA